MLYRALAETAGTHPDKIAVSDNQGSLSFGQLLCKVDEAAAFLRSFKVKAEEPILVGIPPYPDFYAMFYAACSVGATVVPLLPSEKIPPIVRDLDPALAVGEKPFLRAAEALCPRLRGSIPWTRSRGLEFAAPANPLPSPARPIRAERILAILTSGTTGDATLHYTTAEALLRHGKLRAETLEILADDILLSTRPFNNLASIDATVMLPIVSGCQAIVRDRFRRFEVAKIISNERATVLYGVPIIFEMLASVPPAHPADFSSLRLCVSGGAPLTRYVLDKFRSRFNLLIRQRYGGTHFFPAFNFDVRGVAGAIGQVTGPFPMTIVGERGQELPAGAIGEIAFDFSKLAPFWKRCLTGNPYRRGKYIYTGDLGKVDAEGNVSLVGRKSSFIKVGGNRVAPAEVESVLRSHPQVSEAIVFPLRVGQSDEAVAAIVVPGGRLTSDTLAKHCAQHLDGYKCPRRIELRKSLPRNSQGKIMRYLLDRASAENAVGAVEAKPKPRVGPSPERHNR